MTSSGYDSMMQCTIAGALIALSLTQIAVAQGTRTEVLKLTVSREPSIEGMKVFGGRGLELEVGVLVKDTTLLAIDFEQCKLHRFVDDKGTDLSEGALGPGGFKWVQMVTYGAEATDACMLKLETFTLPAKRAGRIELEAEIALKCASGSQKEEAKVQLKKGAEIDCGPVPLKIRSVEEVDFGDSKFSVQLASDQSMDAIKALEFLGADGKPMKAEPMGSGSFGFGGKKTYTRSYGLPERPGEVTVRITAYANNQTVVVPLKLSIGMGLR